MSVRKVSISIASEALDVIDELAREQGVTRSGWIEQAAAQELRRAGLSRAVRGHERSTGKRITTQDVDRARRALGARD